jgi:hypothetical protein
MNKYNFIYIKLRLSESDDPDVAYRQYILRKFFSLNTKKKSTDIKSRHFRIYF